MRLIGLPLAGAYVIEPEMLVDARGYFGRVYCQREFEAHNLTSRFVQNSVSYNARKGTLRGMHYQASPHQEAKLVQCIRGALYDVIVDLRDDSPTYRKWHALELSADTLRVLYVPKGFAHGFQTLADDTVLYYQISEFYRPDLARGLRWDDPALAIAWPDEERTISERDRSHPLL